MRTSTVSRLGAGLLALSLPLVALAKPVMGEVEKQPLNLHAIGMFFVFVLLTLGITYWAASRTKTTADFYTAGGGITGF
ncbi:MAG: cation acetate symporter, partial [Betaproteobacteria bacterium HGW-Betaproteobacteria-21]